jgi:hypothetical protein
MNKASWSRAYWVVLALACCGCVSGMHAPGPAQGLACVYVPAGASDRFRLFFKIHDADIDRDENEFLRFANTPGTRHALIKYAKMLMTERNIITDNIARFHTPDFVPRQVLFQQDGTFRIEPGHTPVNLDEEMHRLRIASMDYLLCLKILEKLDPSIVYIHPTESIASDRIGQEGATRQEEFHP